MTLEVWSCRLYQVGDECHCRKEKDVALLASRTRQLRCPDTWGNCLGYSRTKKGTQSEQVADSIFCSASSFCCWNCHTDEVLPTSTVAKSLVRSKPPQ